jgi:phosphate transport system substrate-binding protein
MKTTIACCAFLLLMHPGCAPEKTETTTRGNLHALIAESTAPAMVEEVNQFLNLYSQNGAKISYELVSSEEAIRRMVRDTARFIVCARPLSSSERQRASAVEGFNLNEVLVAFDGIVVVVNEKNPVEQVTMTNLQKILSGELNRWEQLSSGRTMKGNINVLFQDSSDVSLFAETRIFHGQTVRKDARHTGSSLETLRSVAQQPSSIGLVGVLWIDSARLPVKVLKVAETQQVEDTLYRAPHEALGKFYSPHPANIYRTYYPLKRALYIYTLSPLGSLATGFASFVANPDGQRLLLNRNIVPGTQRIRLRSPE